MEAIGTQPKKQKRRARRSKPKESKSQELIVQQPQPISLLPGGQIAIPTQNEVNVQIKPTNNELNQVNNLVRQSSKRNRKKKNPKKLETTGGPHIEPISLEQIFPDSESYKFENLSINRKKESSQQKIPQNKVTFNLALKNCSVENIDVVDIFPVLEQKQESPTLNFSEVENIELDELFPSKEIFTFEHYSNIRKSEKHSPKEVPKLQTAVKILTGIENISIEDLFPCTQKTLKPAVMNPQKPEKSREEVKAEREAKKATKQAAKSKPKESAGSQNPNVVKKSDTDSSLAEKMVKLSISEQTPNQPSSAAQKQTQPNAANQLSKAERKALFEAQNPSLAGGGEPKGTKPATSKAERRALQEAQRAAKEAAKVTAKPAAPAVSASAESKDKPKPVAVAKSLKKEASPALKKSSKSDSAQQKPQAHMVKLFNHLYTKKFAASEIVNSPQLHPVIARLGLQYAEGVMAGSKARCLAFLSALGQVIKDYETPPEKEFSRGFEEALNPNIAFLQNCRPFSVSMTNALKYIKMYARQLNVKDSESNQKEFLLEAIDTYVRDQIEKAEEAISISVQDKIYDGDVILTYGCSSLIKHILEEACRRKKNYRVVIVDSRPRNNEHEMMRQLVARGIDCTCVLINAISYVMPEVTKVLLSAHALLANGCVMSRVGTAQIALVAKSYNVPVLVCCETHKFSERVQTDAFVYNEIGNPNDLILNSGTRENRLHNPLSDWESIPSLTPLNLHYDVTPPELVTAVVTEVAILPCTSVPVILRIKPSEVGY
ncbi:translation initiation factor eIF-2B subunit delta [Uranotaenia lowii]|uniref:translation initiation factor eIF-2B subunit delta n=1 Tax=Uranotaenia lowii TaxID=190385 RepID=UPI00247A8566|nr:translation initiation factor eIF-2B subunit delta [Uranotaenia lowii]XP_055608365.1 translation initiation factor eIF-2B subunit delta [Uranotaenia lowii]